MPRSHGHFEDLGTVHPIGIGPRRVRAYRPPPGLAGGRAKVRPLLVMFDGQNVFGDAGSFAGGWHIHESIDRFAHARRTPAPIVVAIDHGGVARIDELAPYHDGLRGGGKLAALIATVVDELLPRVHARFEIGARFIGGSSLGGLAALYAHLLRPDIFEGALAMSPSLWFTRARVAALLHSRPRPTRSRIYLDCGAREGTSMWPAIETFANRLRRRGWHDAPSRTDRRVMLRVEARGRHHEAAWRRRFPKALRFLLAV